MSTGRGKWAEHQVQKRLKGRKDIAFHRFPDALAGYKQPTPCDFMVLKDGVTTLIEVKEVQHTHLLPYKNVPIDQIARMRLWAIQGAWAFVIVAFRGNSGKSIWTYDGIETFISRPTDPKPGQTRRQGSWDMKDYDLESLETILGHIIQ